MVLDRKKEELRGLLKDYFRRAANVIEGLGNIEGDYEKSFYRKSNEIYGPLLTAISQDRVSFDHAIKHLIEALENDESEVDITLLNFKTDMNIMESELIHRGGLDVGVLTLIDFNLTAFYLHHCKPMMN